MKLIYNLLFCLIFINCISQNKKISNCGTEDLAIQTISKLKEVQLQQKYIDSISNHTKGVSYMTDEKIIKNKAYYEVATGYNGELRWETYYLFYVNKKNCDDIYVNEVVSGDIISIAQWRKLKAKKAKY
ncbi:hypothetical protein [Flavobacterium sp. PS2]|uniref:hypothetical protein n=1 Tax=Flavobacterium sp. PS2 TaxID=3384157 RepID=UPI00390C5307